MINKTKLVQKIFNCLIWIFWVYLLSPTWYNINCSQLMSWFDHYQFQLVNSWESLGLKGDPTSPSKRKWVLNVHWKDWCWSWNSNTLATWCEDLTHWKRPWCWERLKAGGEGDDREWDGWMASPTQWTSVQFSSVACSVVSDSLWPHE